MVFNLSHIQDKHVIVTGASAGIGAAAGILFAKAGANVTLVARRADKLEEAKKAALGAHKESGINKGGKVSAFAVDLSDIKAIDKLVGDIKGSGLPPVDVLVNNAGGVRGKEPVGDISPSDVDLMLDLNVKGLIHLTQLYVQDFKRRNTGHVINLGSVAGREAYAGGSIYCATKFAVHAFTNSLLKELVNTQVRVSEVQPGMVETEFSLVRFRGDQAAADAVYKGIKALTGEDVAEEIVWIASRPPHVNVAETFVMSVNQASAGIIHRE